MDFYPVFTNSDEGRARVNPASTVEIVRAVFALLHRGVGVAAEDACYVMALGIGKGTGCDLRRQPQPARVQAVKKTGENFVFRIPLLQLQVEERSDQVADAHVADNKSI